MGTGGVLAIVARDGHRLPIDHRYRQVSRAIEYALDRLHEQFGEDASFEPFSLAGSELRHARKGALALAEIERVEVDGRQLAVYQRGQRRAWASAPLASVRNSTVLVESLADRGLTILASPALAITPAVKAKVAAAAARQAALPRAHVVDRG